jgi:hypothetical protein
LYEIIEGIANASKIDLAKSLKLLARPVHTLKIQFF